MPKKKHKRQCPCGSKLFFEDCCQTPNPGETPKKVKEVINKIVKDTFIKTGYYLGEACLYSSLLTKELLNEFDIKSYVVAGSSKWHNYPTWFQYLPNDEPMQFHAWLITEYGEIVDLSCDAFENRQDAHTLGGVRLGIKPPSVCWSKEINDRKYIVRNIGAKSFPVDKRVMDVLLKEAKVLIERDRTRANSGDFN